MLLSPWKHLHLPRKYNLNKKYLLSTLFSWKLIAFLYFTCFRINKSDEAKSVDAKKTALWKLSLEFGVASWIRSGWRYPKTTRFPSVPYASRCGAPSVHPFFCTTPKFRASPHRLARRSLGALQGPRPVLLRGGGNACQPGCLQLFRVGNRSPERPLSPSAINRRNSDSMTKLRYPE